MLHHEAGDFDATNSHLAQAVAVFVEIGDQPSEVALRTNIAVVAMANNDSETAKAEFRKAIPAAEACKHPSLQQLKELLADLER
jgi:Flp pilus assembly protein TadD